MRRGARPAFRLGIALAALVAAGAMPREGRAQAATSGRPELTLELPPDSLLLRRGPLVRAEHMLAGDRIQKLLLAGFPARFHFRVSLWTEAFIFDNLERSQEFDVLVRYLPGERVYEVVQVADERALPLGRHAALRDAERAIGRATLVPVTAVRSDRRQYYQATLVVEVLSERDVDDVLRWLQGDVEPGITGRANPASVVTRGLRTLASRLLGGEKREYEVTSPGFRVR